MVIPQWVIRIDVSSTVLGLLTTVDGCEDGWRLSGDSNAAPVAGADIWSKCDGGDNTELGDSGKDCRVTQQQAARESSRASQDKIKRAQ